MSLVISRIKVISNLDISEKRVPQDGRTQIKVAGKTLDIRVSILPTFYGERVVMRILMQSEDILSIKELGFPSYITDELESVLGNSYGMVLVTGPTGSGKSTTLACIIDQINQNQEKHIITLEDPLEFLHRHNKSIVSQREIHVDTDSYVAALRAALRQSPDVILLEIGRASCRERVSSPV